MGVRICGRGGAKREMRRLVVAILNSLSLFSLCPFALLFSWKHLSLFMITCLLLAFWEHQLCLCYSLLYVQCLIPCLTHSKSSLKAVFVKWMVPYTFTDIKKNVIDLCATYILILWSKKYDSSLFKYISYRHKYFSRRIPKLIVGCLWKESGGGVGREILHWESLGITGILSCLNFFLFCACIILSLIKEK